MLCATISGPTFSEAQQQILDSLSLSDIIEIRVDALSSLSDEELSMLITIAKQSILTFKTSSAFSLTSWIKKIKSLAALAPTYLDIDKNFPKATLKKIQVRHPKLKIILSYHTDTEEDLHTLHREMLLTPADYYKIVLSPTNTSQTLKYIQEACCLPSNTTLLCTGPYGLPSRLLSPFIGNAMNYAAGIQSPRAVLGQPSINELLNYNYTRLTKELKIYGLIGNPLNNSLSHLTHNFLFTKLGFNAIYIKLPVSKDELTPLFSMIRSLPFHGLSVTMPLKTAVLNYVDILDKSATHCNSINTLVLDKRNILGYNTDGLAVVHLLQSHCIPIEHQHVAILGAGGAASGIATALATQGAHIHIFNRTLSNAQQLARLCHGKAYTLDSLPTLNRADILINSLPSQVPFPWIFPSTIMDINTLPYFPPYLQEARKRGVSVLHGYEMFIEQALLQFALWFPDTLTKKDCDLFRNFVKNLLITV
ncbi:bifunctional 3-dehydroquinate dehydratase/shikimate dehydrogenase [Candidatus Chlamydia sanziniae]|uniref:Shikimate dehydrogenase (NADP(+)) n=1 Tax=Candidatus Chlamydia sanziniae TaxID=1806891 RepID=A0A1A9HVU8_9CHLA|nr:bifunctional 3-dehydroquinate dehydratase/shikimate dehydrogenase [Candidatus Chlamydia sanziniae]ANH78827.1 3-dehydroquinate dehydratase I [Candidatus Chlamydia sanziniae]